MLLKYAKENKFFLKKKMQHLIHILYKVYTVYCYVVSVHNRHYGSTDITGEEEREEERERRYIFLPILKIAENRAGL